VLHDPSAAHARIMEAAGVEVAFVGTSGVVGAYTGLADVGVATMTECVTIAGLPVVYRRDQPHSMSYECACSDATRAFSSGFPADPSPVCVAMWRGPIDLVRHRPPGRCALYQKA
jgi:2,3-dimethylmalate lyase